MAEAHPPTAEKRQPFKYTITERFIVCETSVNAAVPPTRRPEWRGEIQVSWMLIFFLTVQVKIPLWVFHEPWWWHVTFPIGLSSFLTTFCKLSRKHLVNIYCCITTFSFCTLSIKSWFQQVILAHDTGFSTEVMASTLFLEASNFPHTQFTQQSKAIRQFICFYGFGSWKLQLLALPRL